MASTARGSLVFGYKVDGDKELIKVMRSLSKDFQQQALVAAVSEGAKIIEAEAKARAPVATGGLRDNIIHEVLLKKPKNVEVGVSWRVAGGSSRNAAFYGVMVEKGTKPRANKTWRKKPLAKPKSTGTMPAQPFLGPAWDAKKDAPQRKIKNELSDMIRKKVKRNG